MAKTISATNETFKQALLYIGAARAGHTPPKLPDGVTQSDISNVEYQVYTWPMIVPPRPIEFYGRVVDENGEPIAGATAHFEWDGTVTNRNAMEIRDWPKVSAEVTTDDKGLFSFTGKSGTELDVSVAKVGYYSSRTNRGVQYFKYSKPNLDSFDGTGHFFKPDADHPVVYYLRKIGAGANALITSGHGMRESFWATVPKDGTSVKVDLLHQKTGVGPLEIKQKKPEFPAHGGTMESFSPSDRAKLASATNWSITMRISDGGFIEENDEFPFEPPESGYQSTVNYSFQKGQGEWQGNWSMNFQKNFYIKFGSPAIYGQLHLETWADNEQVILTYVINPDGSRNLEPKQGYFPSSSQWTH